MNLIGTGLAHNPLLKLFIFSQSKPLPNLKPPCDSVWWGLTLIYTLVQLIVAVNIAFGSNLEQLYFKDYMISRSTLQLHCNLRTWVILLYNEIFTYTCIIGHLLDHSVLLQDTYKYESKLITITATRSYYHYFELTINYSNWSIALGEQLCTGLIKACARLKFNCNHGDMKFHFSS